MREEQVDVRCCAEKLEKNVGIMGARLFVHCSLDHCNILKHLEYCLHMIDTQRLSIAWVGNLVAD